MSLSNLEYQPRITIFKTTLVKQTMLLICSLKLSVLTGGGESIFDNISKDDLIIAFFPCIYFTGSVNPCYFTLENTNYKCMSMQEKFDQMLKRADNRNDFYKLLYKMVANVLFRDLRLIIENPFSALHYLHNNFLKEPTVIDINRQKRGDYFRKPTGYWFFNCVNTIGESYQKPEKYLTVWEAKSAPQQGLCSEERSMISPDYARNFICDFIIGKTQDNIEQQLLF